MAIEGGMIDFRLPAGEARGYLAAARGGEKGSDERRPGLIVIHEWWGLNDHIKDIAGRFAEEGYIALAPDLYGGKVTADPTEAGRLMQGLDQGRALEILNGAVEYLKGQDSVDPGKIGVTGFCMGGTYALLLACHSKDIKASAPFYGDVPADDEIKKLDAPVLFIGAENDPWITQDKMARLKDALGRFGKEGEVKVYSGTGHAFFNDTRPDAYDKASATDAWQQVKRFLAAHLG
jgi:carboxymethylenebutenolidase